MSVSGLKLIMAHIDFSCTTHTKHRHHTHSQALTLVSTLTPVQTLGVARAKMERPVISTRGPDELFFHYLILHFYYLTILRPSCLDTAAIHLLKYKHINNNKGF